MQLGSLGHLTYCTNIHPAETFDEVIKALGFNLPKIKAAVSPESSFGVGLRLSNKASTSLFDEQNFEALKQLLNENNCYVFTINGFPYGPFFSQPVKQEVYKPDWGEVGRLNYSNSLADHLARLIPSGITGTISSVPGTFKAWIDENKIELIVQNLIKHVAHLHKLKDRTGKTIALALEPEPACMLETVKESVDFFNKFLFSRRGLNRLSVLLGLTETSAEEVMRRHIGICYDVCHAAVEFEDPVESIRTLRSNDIRILKLQLSSALKIVNVSKKFKKQLSKFADDIYLHQTVQKKDKNITRFTDLPDALNTIETVTDAEWRTHFHVPIFLDRMGNLDTTQSFLKDILKTHIADPISSHLEIETYTWEVLPSEYRNVPVHEAISREINWVLGELKEQV